MPRLFVVLVTLALAQTAFADDVADVYKAKCKACHGDDGKAQTAIGKKQKVPDMSTPEWQAKHSDAEITKVITVGSEKNDKMKAFGPTAKKPDDKLSDAQIAALVKYVRGFKK